MFAEFNAARALMGQSAQRVLQKYFSYDAVKSRLDYRPKNLGG